MVRLTDRPDMTIVVDWNIKNQTKPNKNERSSTQVVIIFPILTSYSI